MATAFLGKISEFVLGQNASWEEYIEQLDFTFQANKVTEDSTKRAILLSACGQRTFSLIRSLVSPQKPAELTYKELVLKVQDHVSPKPPEIVQRFHFFKRNQNQSEKVSDYVVELRRLSQHCNFGNTLENMLRDRLVCGLFNEATQRRLLAEPNLSFQKALDIAVASESAQRHVTDIRSSVNSTMEGDTVNKIYNNNRGRNEEQQFSKPCFRCGNAHSPDTCKFAEVSCRFCNKKGHIAAVCLSKQRSDRNATGSQHSNFKPDNQKAGKGRRVFLMEQENTPERSGDNSEQSMYFLNHVTDIHRVDSFNITVALDGVKHIMEIDSGSACSIISEDTYQRLWPKMGPALSNDEMVLRTWTHQQLRIRGTVQVKVDYRNISQDLRLIVVEGSGTSLLGRDWFQPLGIQVVGIHQCPSQTEESSDLLQTHAPVFSEKLGLYTGPPVRLDMDANVRPIFLKSRPVPFALREKVNTELDKLVDQGILVPVTYSEWATPIVPVLKSDGTMRICGDYRSTVNSALKPDVYPLPNISDLLATLSGGQKFSKLDLTQAYQQLPVDEESAMILTLNTPKGLFKVTRMPYGISAAPGIFQRCMETHLAGLDGVEVYLDDILVSGDASNHDSRLEKTLSKLRDAGLTLKEKKCEFGVDSIEFVGFRIDANGVHPTEEKVQAIHGAPTPTCKTELQAFLGLLNFYNVFLKDRATVLEPLHRLLDNGALWKWTPEHATAFQGAKMLLQSSDILTHYNSEQPLLMICDASSYGVGAVLAHVNSTHQEMPVAYASRTMSKTERNYSQIDREAMALVFGVLKFHKYVYGRPFVLVTDHKPLLGLLDNKKRMPAVMSPRMLRWSLLLSAYNYTLQYRPGKEIGNADGLSRLPLPISAPDPPGPADILMLECVLETPVTAERIATLTRRDTILSRVLRWVLQGWPSEKQSEEFKPFESRKLELSVHKGCLLWGSRVIIPLKIREEVLRLMHGAHPGIVQMKSIARSYAWWPQMDAQIEDYVKKCDTCQVTRNDPNRAPIHAWEWPEKPWSRLHLDFAGPFHGQIFLIVVDAHSKWTEVLQMPSMSSHAVVDKLRQLFATHGLPDTVVSDNGTAFVSAEFKEFLRRNGIRGTTVAPYHPASNGQAERMVQTTKQALRRMGKGDWTTRLSRFLIAQHVTPHATTGISPAELLMKRKLTTVLDRMHPDMESGVRQKQDYNTARPQRERTFNINDPVYMRNYTNGPKWIPAKITGATGPVSFTLESSDGKVWKRHLDQLRARVSNDVPVSQADGNEDPTVGVDHNEPENPRQVQPPVPVLLPVIEPRPVRARNPPCRYGDFVTHHLGGRSVMYQRQTSGQRVMSASYVNNSHFGQRSGVE